MNGNNNNNADGAEAGGIGIISNRSKVNIASGSGTKPNSRTFSMTPTAVSPKSLRIKGLVVDDFYGVVPSE